MNESEIIIEGENITDFEMPLKDGGYISYERKSNTIVIKDKWNDMIEIDANELIRFTNTNLWKYLSSSSKQA